MNSLQPIRRHLLNTALHDLRLMSKPMRVPFQTLYNIREGITKNPRIKTVDKIADHFAKMT